MKKKKNQIQFKVFSHVQAFSRNLTLKASDNFDFQEGQSTF